MAIGTNVLFTGTWGSGPAIPVEFSYSKYRSGANMVYRVFVEIKPVTGAHYFGYPIQVSSNIEGQVTTTTVKNASPSQWSSSITFDSGDKTIANKTSGTTALTITLTGVGASRGSQTYAYNLPIDPAMSPISTNDMAIGSTGTITIHRTNSNFKHSMYYKINGQSSFTFIADNLTTSCGFTVPQTCYDYMPSNKSYVGVTFQCHTYDAGGTYIGTTSCSINVWATYADCYPNATLQVKPVTARTALTGSADVLINNDNGIQITATSSAKKGATIAKNVITNGSDTYNGLTKTLTSIKTGNFSFTATDSRGIQNTVSTSKTFVAYIRPTISITNPSVSTGGVATFTIKGNWFNGSFGSQNNSLIIQYGYKETGSSDVYTWNVATATTSGNTYSANVSISGLDYTKQYSFQARVDDKLYSAYSNEAQAQAIPIFDWGKDDFQFNVRTFVDEDIYMGHKIDGGTESNQTTERRLIFKSENNPYPHKSGLYGGNPNSYTALGAWDWKNNRRIMSYEDTSNNLYLGDGANTNIYINQNPIVNHIKQHGVSGNWYYRIYTNNIVELFATIPFSGVNAAKNHYSGFYYSDAIGINYPFTIKQYIAGEICGGSTSYINFVKPCAFSTNRLTYWVCGNDAGATSCSGSVYIHIIGWYQ